MAVVPFTSGSGAIQQDRAGQGGSIGAMSPPDEVHYWMALAEMEKQGRFKVVDNEPKAPLPINPPTNPATEEIVAPSYIPASQREDWIKHRKQILEYMKRK